MKYSAPLLLASVSLFVLACTGKTVVGQEADADDGSSADDASLPPYEASGPCAAQDQFAHQPYEDWRRSPNDFGNLEGTWTGHIEAGQDVELRLTGGSGTIRFGNEPTLPPPTSPDEPYACLDPDKPACVPYSGAVSGFDFSLHGATVVDDHLKFPLAPYEAWNSWCALQTPTSQEPEGTPPSCYYQPYPNREIEVGDHSCFNGDESIDCALLDLYTRNVCECASDGCFQARLLSAFDFRILDGGNQLIGTIGDEGRVELTKN